MSYPLVGGWGGVRIKEAAEFSSGNPASIVFSGERASDTETALRMMKDRGYNCFRSHFCSPLLEPENQAFWGWDHTLFERTLEMARALDMWIIVDYHGYDDLRLRRNDWISWWRTNIIRQYRNSYDKMIWQPMNEPVVFNGDPQDSINMLGEGYQEWINMCRGEGDVHWLVMHSACWYTGDIEEYKWWPFVDDPLNRVFLDRHWYYFYEWNNWRWTQAEARAYADEVYNDVILRAIQRYNKPFITTEFGCEPGAGAPDTIGPYPNYTPVTLAFIQRLVDRFDSANPRIGYIFWSGGNWTESGVGGGMNTWDPLLSHRDFPITPVAKGYLDIHAYKNGEEIMIPYEVT